MTSCSPAQCVQQPVPYPDEQLHATFDLLCTEVRLLSYDQAFLAYVSQPARSLNEALRYAQDSSPRLESLPLEVLAQELRALLPILQCCPQ